MKNYGHIVSAVYGKPWAIMPSTLAVIVDMLRFRVEGGLLTSEEIEARIEAAGPRTRQTAQPVQGVAVLPLHGIIAPRAAMLEQTSAGGTGLDRYMGAFRAAMADPDVGTIVMDIDSPGGQVDGVPEAAAEIRAARDQKRVIGVANTLAASAAYWLGSQASEFVAPVSAQVGSIGVYGAHEDLSAAYDKAGVKVTLISAGKFKTEGNDLGPLSEEGMAHRQEVVDEFYGMFVNDVAAGRRVDPAAVRGGYGEGRMLTARKAPVAGLVDRIDTLGGAIAGILAGPVAGSLPVVAGAPDTLVDGWTDPAPEWAASVKDWTEEPDPAFEYELERRRRAARGR